MTNIKDAIYRLKMDWVYSQQEDCTSITHWWECVKYWWRHRPVVIPCKTCGRKMWVNGTSKYWSFCSQDCAEAFFDKPTTEDIPF
jgi:hypothetical protein